MGYTVYLHFTYVIVFYYLDVVTIIQCIPSFGNTVLFTVMPIK